MGRPRHSSRQIQALLALLAAEPDRWRYGYELAAEAGISSGTLYPALARLADDHLLEHRWEIPDGPGRPRHCYRLTVTGRRMAAEQAAASVAPTRSVGPRFAH